MSDLTLEQWNEIEDYARSLSPLTKKQLRIEAISTIPNHTQLLGTDKSKWCYYSLLMNWMIQQNVDVGRYPNITLMRDCYRINEIKWTYCSTINYTDGIRPIN